MSAEALESSELCGNEKTVVPTYGKKDTIIKPLLVEVSNLALLVGHTESQKTSVKTVRVPTFFILALYPLFQFTYWYMVVVHILICTCLYNIYIPHKLIHVYNKS